MKFFIHAALATYASALTLQPNKQSPLTIDIKKSGNTEVKVSVTNNGPETLNLLSKGTFLDEDLPVERVSVFSNKGSKKIPFEGIKIRLLTSGLNSKDFLSLAPKETKTITVETAALHTLTDGGDFNVFAKGYLPYATGNSTELSGSIAYESNKLSMLVDGAIAAKIAKTFSKRTIIKDSCEGGNRNAIETAIGNCRNLASAASSAAASGTKLDQYFKSSSASTKNTVSSRLKAVADDCGGGSTTTTACVDTLNGCRENVLAYTVPSTNAIVYCETFFKALPGLATTCHGQDQATTVIHEMTHAPGVFSPGTDDLGYGFDAATKLSLSQALNNADSYALYANAINLNC
ncbi:neutral protease 2-like protein [Periconia macrospinosa]|uniref:Neutral protease 2 n=1 Tax=Periconia macrospinosa TaxID=97972 RepID=A0A2V1E3V2_9PLEO|nr:neutral protease 2-like protein [Periconia macrospinosa]